MSAPSAPSRYRHAGPTGASVLVVVLYVTLGIASAAIAVGVSMVMFFNLVEKNRGEVSSTPVSRSGPLPDLPARLNAAPNAARADDLRGDVQSYLKTLWLPGEKNEDAPDWERLVLAVVEQETQGPDALGQQGLQELAVVNLEKTTMNPLAAHLVARALGNHPASRRLLDDAVMGLGHQEKAEMAAFLAATDRYALPSEGAEPQKRKDLSEALSALRRVVVAEAGFSRLPDHVVVFLLSGGNRARLHRNASLELMESVAAAPETKPWLKYWLEGRHHLNLALADMPDGSASNGSHRVALGKAEACLKAAVAERAETAAPWADLVLCAAMKGRQAVPEMLAAFRQVLAVQVDHEAALGNVMEALGPSWYGSPAAMVQFGDACLAGEAFHSALPWWSLWPHQVLARERGDWPVYFEELTRPQRYDVLFEEAGRDPRRAPWGKYDRSTAVMWHLLCQRPEQARQALEKLNGPLHPGVLRAWGFPSDLAVRQRIAALTSLDGELLEAAARAEAAFLPANAGPIYDKLLRRHPGMSGGARAYTEQRLAAMQREKALLGGEEVALVPSPEMTDWSATAGEWQSRPEGTLEHRGLVGSSVISHARMGGRLVLRGEVEFAGEDAMGEVGFSIGNLLELREEIALTVRFVVEDGRVRAVLSQGRNSPLQRTGLGEVRPLVFELHVQPEGVGLEVNGKRVWLKEPVPLGGGTGPHARLGLGAVMAAPEGVVRVRRLGVVRI